VLARCPSLRGPKDGTGEGVRMLAETTRNLNHYTKQTVINSV